MNRPSVVNEVHNALDFDNSPIESATSLLAVEMWHRSRNPIWIKVWIELNFAEYNSVAQFAGDMAEVFDF